MQNLSIRQWCAGALEKQQRGCIARVELVRVRVVESGAREVPEANHEGFYW